MTAQRIVIKQDLYASDPLEGGDWRVVDYINNPHATHDLSRIGLNRKLKCGTAYVLKCYRHGCTVWSLQGDGRIYVHGAWDTTFNAGLLIYNGNVKYLPKDLNARRKLAQSVIDEYSSWANGDVVGWVLEDSDGKVVDSCWGYIGGHEYAIKDAKAAAKVAGFDVEGISVEYEY